MAKGSEPNQRCDSLIEPPGQIFDYLEWIARVTSHIPEKGAQSLHYYGAYSNAHRGKRAKSAASAVPHSALAVEPETEWIKRESSAINFLKMVDLKFKGMTSEDSDLSLVGGISMGFPVFVTGKQLKLAALLSSVELRF